VDPVVLDQLNHSDIAITSNATSDSLLAEFLEPSAMGMCLHISIGEQCTLQRALALGRGSITTWIRVTLNVWEDGEGLPCMGNIVIELQEVHPSGKATYADASRTLNVPTRYWTDPYEPDFKHNYLDPIFDKTGNLMKDESLWQNRSKTSKNRLRPPIMTSCRAAFERYADDFLARALEHSKK
jgi:hypothetical protein